jgi:hypothetical protein
MESQMTSRFKQPIPLNFRTVVFSLVEAATLSIPCGVALAAFRWFEPPEMLARITGFTAGICWVLLPFCCLAMRDCPILRKLGAYTWLLVWLLAILTPRLHR